MQRQVSLTQRCGLDLSSSLLGLDTMSGPGGDEYELVSRLVGALVGALAGNKMVGTLAGQYAHTVVWTEVGEQLWTLGRGGNQE